MFHCIKSISDSRAASHAKKFKVYARLIRMAAAAGGELNTADTVSLSDVLEALHRGTDEADGDIAGLIELARLEPIAAGLADAEKAHAENVEQDRAVYVNACVKRATIDATMRAKSEWMPVGEIDAFQKLKDMNDTEERTKREAIQNAGRVLFAQLNLARDAGRRARELRAKLAAILEPEPGDTTGENGDAPKAAA